MSEYLNKVKTDQLDKALNNLLSAISDLAQHETYWSFLPDTKEQQNKKRKALFTYLINTEVKLNQFIHCTLTDVDYESSVLITYLSKEEVLKYKEDNKIQCYHELLYKLADKGIYDTYNSVRDKDKKLGVTDLIPCWGKAIVDNIVLY